MKEYLQHTERCQHEAEVIRVIGDGCEVHFLECERITLVSFIRGLSENAREACRRVFLADLDDHCLTHATQEIFPPHGTKLSEICLISHQN